MIAGSNDTRAALVTPPVQTFAAWQQPATVALHARPRLDAIGTPEATAPAPPPQAHGGLSPGAMRRVREYAHAHLGDSVDLATLAVCRGRIDVSFRKRI